ncbi:MAG TPA: 8-amino-7-oxononanoate synthase [Gammaproteobacteria bacterium]|mgnify:CR=1 FL=1|nr:8-amino-7-oxononanoate synthase [Gammaproteobacteria bacterium]
MSKFDFIDQELQRRDVVKQHRVLKNIRPLPDACSMVDGRPMVNFSSNDYLGLAMHPELQQRAHQFSKRYGSGSSASRLITGSLDCFEAVEQKLATLKSVESILIFNSGFQANVSVIPTLVDQDSLILSDRLNHNSIIHGITLARCDKLIFDHNNLDHLETLLAANPEYSRKLIVTESVFSMDGDQSDIDRLVDIAGRYDAILFVDEAHATGVLGPGGMGLTAWKNVDVTVGTFSKAMGSFGAYVASSAKIRDYLINCCAGFVYTTALPASTLGAIDAALDLVPNMDAERETLQANAEFLRQALQQIGYNTGGSTTQIIPVLLGDEQQTLRMSEKLEDAGFLATPIRPPTVPDSRIRLTLSAAHTREQIDALVNVFRD